MKPARGKRDPKSIGSLLGKAIKCKPKMVRFYALRMLVELANGKQLSPDDQHRLYNKASIMNTNEVFDID